MDLERIKQNLRLRSGRLKKKPRKFTGPLGPAVQQKASESHSEQANAPPRPSSARPPAAVIYSPAKEEPSPRNRDTSPALSPIPLSGPARSHESRPDLPRAATRADPSSHLPDSSSRYGRSGIERPTTGASPKPNTSKGPLAVRRSRSETDTGVIQNTDTDALDVLDFDLRPPPPRSDPPSVESLSESLFSPGHLQVLLRHPGSLAYFTSFLAKYQPQSQRVLLNFLEIQKAIKAVEYANAVAEGIASRPTVDEDSPSTRPSTAATLDKAFEESSEAAFHLLADTALPAFVAYSLVKVVSECLVHEITGRPTPLSGDSVGGLSEVFCLTDPHQEDNPIIFASSEFYRFTGYGPDDVIGRNCRFLQGTRTKRDSVSRLRSSIEDGHEICETLLNYRRDGRPFINLLLIAPLHDDEGNVKYHIGAQVDVTGLVERGRGLAGFGSYLAAQEIEAREREIENSGKTVNGNAASAQKSRALTKLRDLSATFDLEESAVLRSHSRSAYTAREYDEGSVGSSRKAPRRLIDDLDTSSADGDGDQAHGEDASWTLGDSGQFASSGKLPGVYDSYMLIRPAPSLRIVFVSPKLRRRLGNIIQDPFLSHVAAPSKTLTGLKESFGTGVPVSAKIHFLYRQSDRRDGIKISVDKKPDESGESQICWISATPLLGSDNSVGVWMVVVVDKTQAIQKSRLENGAETNVSQQPISNKTGRPTKISIPARSLTGEQQQWRPGKIPDQEELPEDIPKEPTTPEQAVDPGNVVRLAYSPVQNGHTDQPNEKQTKSDEPQEVEGPQSSPTVQTEAEHDSDFMPVDTNHTTPGLDDLAHSTDESVGRAFHMNATAEWQRAQLHLGGDSDGEVDVPMTMEEESALYHSVADLKAGADEESLAHDSPYARETVDETNVFHGFSDDEDTPRRLPHLNHFESGSASPSPLKSNSKHYMDYLLHPGSRPSSEYNRTLSGSGLLSSMYHTEEAEHNDVEDDGEDFNDAQCARTPYSVD